MPIPRRFDRRPPERDTTRINERIRVPEVRLIDEKGEQVGVVKTAGRARAMRASAISTWSRSPPRRDRRSAGVLDYSKYKYEQEQRRKAARKHQQQVTIREMKLRPKIATHDYETKKGHILRFLKQGHKVKVTIMFRGREMAHPERGEALLRKLADEIAEFGTIEQQPNQEGRNMTMVVAPVRAPARKQERTAEPAQGGEAPHGDSEPPADEAAESADAAPEAAPDADRRPADARPAERSPLALPARGLRDRVLRLRPPRESDAHAIAEGCSDAEIARWTKVPSPYTLEDARAWIAAAELEPARGNELQLVIAAGGRGSAGGRRGAAAAHRPRAAR